jgi:hypothetical protein
MGAVTCGRAMRVPTLGLIDYWYGYTRKYSPALIEKTPFQFPENSPIGPRLPISDRETSRL